MILGLVSNYLCFRSLCICFRFPLLWYFRIVHIWIVWLWKLYWRKLGRRNLLWKTKQGFSSVYDVWPFSWLSYTNERDRHLFENKRNRKEVQSLFSKCMAEASDQPQYRWFDRPMSCPLTIASTNILHRRVKPLLQWNESFLVQFWTSSMPRSVFKSRCCLHMGAVQ